MIHLQNVYITGNFHFHILRSKVGLVVSKKRFKRKRKIGTSASPTLINKDECTAIYTEFWFWPCGKDTVTFYEKDAATFVKMTQERTNFCCCCCLTCIKKSSIATHERTYRSENVSCVEPDYRRCQWCSVSQNGLGYFCYNFLLGLFIGCASGLWLHFWPCIWWTCDWGEHDGQGVRGGIWFITWAIVSTILWFSPVNEGIIIRDTERSSENYDHDLPMKFKDNVLVVNYECKQRLMVYSNANKQDICVDAVGVVVEAND